MRARRIDLDLQVLAVHDPVDEAALEQELRALEALGQFLADGLLDDTRTGQRSRGFSLRRLKTETFNKNGFF